MSYQLYILIGPVSPPEKPPIDSIIVYTFAEAMTTIERSGVPNFIHLAAHTALEYGDYGNEDMNRFATEFDRHLDALERRQEPGYLTETILVHTQVKNQGGAVKNWVYRISEASKNHQREPVLIRRHQRTMVEMADRFRIFARNGRWGVCVDCPRGQDGQNTLTYPEFCSHNHRDDHKLSFTELVEQYRDCMRGEEL